MTVKWGIIGCGNIAKSFAKGLSEVDDAELIACASASTERAKSFAEEYPCHPCASYEELVRRNDIDVVYIATTHNFHYDNGRLCLENGKNVLCEKPTCVNAKQTRELVALAKAKDLFLMEAMWTRFMPAIRALLDELAAGVIGDIKLVQADFGISRDWPADGRMLNPNLAGGALLDLGIYPLTFAWLIKGAPSAVQSSWTKAETGVDESGCYLLSYADGAMAQLFSGFRTRTPHQARIFGSKGRIVVDDFFHPRGYTVFLDEEEPRVVEADYPSTGYQFEAAEVGRCLALGLKGSALCPMDETITIMDIMDSIRQQWGLVYPGE